MFRFLLCLLLCLTCGVATAEGFVVTEKYQSSVATHSSFIVTERFVMHTTEASIDTCVCGLDCDCDKCQCNDTTEHFVSHVQAPEKQAPVESPVQAPPQKAVAPVYTTPTQRQVMTASGRRQLQERRGMTCNGVTCSPAWVNVGANEQPVERRGLFGRRRGGARRGAWRGGACSSCG